MKAGQRRRRARSRAEATLAAMATIDAPPNPRDGSGRLLCQLHVLGRGRCGMPIAGLTGLQELHGMMSHMHNVHRVSLRMNDALDLRASWGG